ncbi:MAG: hypothetical protein JWN86_305 [Planctomycetota bacterium]|nr:hypothetical protein [Planctomycetota bacterium]
MRRFILDSRTWKGTLAASIASGVALGGLAIADEQPGRPLPAVQWRTTRSMPTGTETPPTLASPTPSPVPTAVNLTPENLPSFLTSLGLNPKVEQVGRNGVVCEVTVVHGTWKAPVHVTISPSGNYLWLVLVLKSDLPEYDQIPGRTLALLLEANDEIGPMHFAIRKGTGKLTFNFGLPSRNVSPQAFRADLEAFVGKAIASESLWNGK